MSRPCRVMRLARFVWGDQMGDHAPASEEADSEAESKAPVQVAPYLTGAIAVITGVTALVGGLTGGVARLARNSPSAIPIIVGLALAAALLSFLASLKPKWHGDPLLLIMSFLLFVCAGFFTAQNLSQSLATPDRPIVSAKWVKLENQWSLEGKVTASGLKTSGQLTVIAQRLYDRGDPPVPAHSTSLPSTWRALPHNVEPGGIVYEQKVGADIEGNAVVEFKIPLPPSYDAMQIIASTRDYLADCPKDEPVGRGETVSNTVLDYACLTLDAPEAIVTTTPMTPTTPPAQPPG